MENTAKKDFISDLSKKMLEDKRMTDYYTDGYGSIKIKNRRPCSGPTTDPTIKLIYIENTWGKCRERSGPPANPNEF